MGKKVLVVDNTMYNRIILRDILVSHGYSVVEASTIEDAVEKYKNIHPDLVTVDAVMPGADGAKTVQQIRMLDPDATVLMCGTNGQRQLVLEGMTSGAGGVILKPFNERQALRAVRQVIG